MSKLELEKSSDEELILLFQEGNEAAFNLLVERFKDPLINFIYRYVGDYDLAADLLQDTFLRVYHKKHLYKTVAKFSTWIYTIAGNLAKSELRSSRRKYMTSISQQTNDDQEFDIPLHDDDPLPDRRSNSTIINEAIQQALLELPEAFREAVVLRDIQELTYEEIAEITDQPIGTVKSRINRGRKQLQELLQDYYE
ncbi:MAG: RNA polymerase subunit sigma-24 [Ectothiorhodospiraceae bacterium]|nr:RNA polymerase subunit sigma-24 [Ectothiorhodospiraceae bacterium]